MLAHLAHAGGKRQKIFLLQLRRHGQAQPRHTLRHRGGDGTRREARLGKALGIAHRQIVGAQNYGCDVRITRPGVESGLLELFAQEATRLPNSIAQPVSRSYGLYRRP